MPRSSRKRCSLGSATGLRVNKQACRRQPRAGERTLNVLGSWVEDQVDASQSGLRLDLGRSFLDCDSAFAVRAHCENQPFAAPIKPLSRPPDVGKRWSDVSF